MNFATIKEVYADGVTLVFDDGSSSAKHYRCNASIVFHAGDRVRIINDGGTYVVEYPVGGPLASLNADTSAAHIGTTISFFGADATTKQTVANLATGATTAQTVTKVNALLTALRGYGLIG